MIKHSCTGRLLPEGDSLVEVEGNNHEKGGGKDVLKSILSRKRMLLLLLLLSCFSRCLTLCDPIDGSPPGSPIPGILQARTLEWAAISFSNA